ncbi:MarR family winged helix-turn-helix transcriptional regulator [Jiangella anatolica]|uniref:MarR family transcriptional regulator n=1 Tax=Jiangella anatolica TaxID=2670374 RepID=A0A2W2B6I9_9ACTN|nr:MarR family transcriptional regulator [Jiangella anatolica]PZF83061.1 MarR family transcriptional regulator [Jiangella anatolica]
MSTDDGAGSPPRAYRLQYLLKRAHLRLAELTGQALAPYGLDPRELAVLVTLTQDGPQSQQELARPLQVDRTTMVAIVDRLEGLELVRRRPDPSDRRKNLIEPTEHGRQTGADATRAVDAAERTFLDAAADVDAAELRDLLWALGRDFRH